MGVSCHQCFDNVTEKQRQRFQDRETQVELARVRGEAHIGSDMSDLQEKNRKAKFLFKDEQRKKC